MNERPGTCPDDARNAPLVALARRTLGAEVAIENVSRTFGRASVLWRLRAADGGAAILKRHESRLLFDRELMAHRDWLPRLGAEAWFALPRLLAHDDDLGAMVTTVVPGEHPDPGEHDPVAVHRQAGRFLARLHALPVEHDVTTTPAILQAMVDRYTGVAEGVLDPEFLAWARERLAEPVFLAARPLVAAHSDYSPRNWLVSGDAADPRIGVIDWERARAGFPLTDACRMVFEHWLDRPELRAAFFEGYGRALTPDEDRRMDLFVLISTIPAVPWARDHGDEQFETQSLRILDVLRERLG